MQLTFNQIELIQVCHEANITEDLNEGAFERCGGKVKKEHTFKAITTRAICNYKK